MTIPSDDPQAPFTLDRTPIWPEEDGRLEPAFIAGPIWVEFDAPEPAVPTVDVAALAFFGETAAFELSEPDPGAAEPEEPSPVPAPTTSPRGFAASLAMHLLVLLLGLLVLAAGNGVPAGASGAFPVQLVLEQSAALPPEQPAGEAVAKNAAPPPPAEAAPPPTPASPPHAPPVRAHAAAVAPPPKPPAPHPPPPAPAPGAPAPAAARQVTRAAVPPAPSASDAPPASAAAEHPAGAAKIVAAATPTSGSGAGGGDYLAYLDQLTRPYLYMLSPAFLAGRRGRTTLSIAVLDDGTISRIGIKESSGYPDIDTRIAEMVQAVGRFPPLPQQLRRPGTDLDFNLVFPDVLQQ